MLFELIDGGETRAFTIGNLQYLRAIALIIAHASSPHHAARLHRHCVT